MYQSSRLIFAEAESPLVGKKPHDGGGVRPRGGNDPLFKPRVDSQWYFESIVVWFHSQPRERSPGGGLTTDLLNDPSYPFLFGF